MSRRDCVLVVSWGVPPRPSGSAVIVGNLAKQFSRDEMVVTGERPRGRPAIVWHHEWPELVYSISGSPLGWRGERWWRALQLPVLLFRSIELARSHRCTAVLVVFPSEGFLFAGYLTAVWTGARLFPYFHNTYLENRRGLSRRFARWLQARVFARAAHVFVMSEGMVELYRARYPGLRCSALPHSFAVGRGDVVPPRDIGSPLRLIISGNINESCSEATVRVCEAIAQIGGASLTLLSPNPRSVLANLGLLRDGVTHEVASPDEVVARLQQADIVVLAHGFDGSLAAEEYRTIFPTRTIEYLICGRPILAHAPPDCYLTRFLLEHDCAVLVTERSVAALTDAIARLRTDAALRARLVRNAVAAAQMFEAPRVAGLLRDRLRAS